MNEKMDSYIGGGGGGCLGACILNIRINIRNYKFKK